MVIDSILISVCTGEHPTFNQLVQAWNLWRSTNFQISKSESTDLFEPAPIPKFPLQVQT